MCAIVPRKRSSQPESAEGTLLCFCLCSWSTVSAVSGALCNVEHTGAGVVEGSKHCKGFSRPEEVELLRNAFNKSHKYSAAARASVLLQIAIMVKNGSSISCQFHQNNNVEKYVNNEDCMYFITIFQMQFN